MWSFPLEKAMVTYQLILLTIQNPALQKDDVLQRGDFCEITQESIQFSEFGPEHSAEEYEIFPESEDDLTFQLSFCTLSKVAVIAELQNLETTQTVSLQMMDGLLSLTVEEFENWRPECVWRFSDKQVNDGVLYTVKIKITPKLITMKLDRMYKRIGNEISVSYSHCVSNSTLSKPRHLLLGGEIIDRHPDGSFQVWYDFDGCMRNIRLNGQPIDKVAKMLTSRGVTPGCPQWLFNASCKEVCPPMAEYRNGFCICPKGTEMNSDDVCSPSCRCKECQNGGTCYTSSTGPHCACPTGYSGEHCEETQTHCSDVLCYHGLCLRDDDPNSFKCHCDPGYQGIFCNETDMCFNNPCKNGGTCQKTTENDFFICRCPPTFSGKVCEERLDILGIGKVSIKPYYIVVVSIVGSCVLLLTSYTVCYRKGYRCPSCSWTKKGYTNTLDSINSSPDVQGNQRRSDNISNTQL